MEEFPSEKIKNKSEKEYLRHLGSRLGIVVAVIFLLFLSWQILGVRSQPGGGFGIQDDDITALSCSGNYNGGEPDGDHWTKNQSGINTTDEVWSACQNNTLKHWSYNYQPAGNNPYTVNTDFDKNGKDNTVSLLPKKGVTWQVRQIWGDSDCSTCRRTKPVPPWYESPQPGFKCPDPPVGYTPTNLGSWGYLYSPMAAYYDLNTRRLRILDAAVCIGTQLPGNQRLIDVNPQTGYYIPGSQIGRHGEWVDVNVPGGNRWDMNVLSGPGSFWGDNYIADAGNQRVFRNPDILLYTMVRNPNPPPQDLPILPGFARLQINNNYPNGRHLICGNKEINIFTPPVKASDVSRYPSIIINGHNPYVGAMNATNEPVEGAKSGMNNFCLVHAAEWGNQYEGLDIDHILVTDAYSPGYECDSGFGERHNRVMLMHRVDKGGGNYAWQVDWEWHVPDAFKWTFSGKLQKFGNQWRAIVSSQQDASFIVSRPFDDDDIKKGPPDSLTEASIDYQYSAFELNIQPTDVNVLSTTPTSTGGFVPFLATDWRGASEDPKDRFLHPSARQTGLYGKWARVWNRTVEVNKTFRHDNVKIGYTSDYVARKDNYYNANRDITGKFIFDPLDSPDPYLQGPADPYRLQPGGTGAPLNKNDTARGKMLGYPLHLMTTDYPNRPGSRSSYISDIKTLTTDTESPRTNDIFYHVNPVRGNTSMHFAIDKKDPSPEVPLWDSTSYQSLNGQKTWNVNKQIPASDARQLMLQAYFQTPNPNDTYFGNRQAQTPYLKGWKLDWDNKSASFQPSKSAMSGTNPNPNSDADYSTLKVDKGSPLFYTGRNHDQIAYKIDTLNTGKWPATGVRLIDTINRKSNNNPETNLKSSGRVTFDKNSNKAYYRLTPAGSGGGTSGTLVVNAAGSKDQWDQNISGCHTQDKADREGWDVNRGYCGYKDRGCSFDKPSGQHVYSSGRCGDVTGCGYYNHCNGAHQWAESCGSDPVWSSQCKYCGGTTDPYCGGPDDCRTCNNCCATALHPWYYCEGGQPGGLFGTWWWDGANWRSSGHDPGRPRDASCPEYWMCRCRSFKGTKCHTDLGPHWYQNIYYFAKRHIDWPKMEVRVNGTKLKPIAVPTGGSINSDNTVNVRNTSYGNYVYNYTVSEKDCVEIIFSGATRSPTTCNLYVNTITMGDGSVKSPCADGRTYSVNNGRTYDCGVGWDGKLMSQNGTMKWPCVSSLPYRALTDIQVGDNNAETAVPLPGGGTQKVPSTVSFRLPQTMTYTNGKTTTEVGIGDRLEIIYTYKIVQAGKITNKAGFRFYNSGNTIESESPFWSGNPQSSLAGCVGNAPYISTQYGDVFLGCKDPDGCQVHPYYSYGNATFLIQSDGSLTNFNNIERKNWVQNKYPLAPELQLSGDKGAVAKVNNNVTKLREQGKLVDPGPELTISEINSLPPDKAGFYRDGNLEIIADPTGAKINNSGGAKIIVVNNGNLTISGNVQYGTEIVNELNKMASLGVVVLKGDMIVAPGVSLIDGAYLVNGTISTGDDTQIINGSTLGRQLKSYGLWVAKEFNLQRVWVGGAEPAEYIIYDGRVALNTPPGFADLNILPVWEEVAP